MKRIPRTARVAGLGVCLLGLLLPTQAAGTPPLRTITAGGVAATPLTSTTGCPADGPIQATPPDQCVAIPSELPVRVKYAKGGGCVQNEYIQVKVPARLDYEAVWYSTIGLGTRWWSAPGTRYPHKVTGLGARYKVPKGWSAWSAAGGSSASGGCGGLPAGTFGTAGWAVVGCNTPPLVPLTASLSRPPARGPDALSAGGSSGPSQDQENWQVLSDLQSKIFTVTQDVTCNKARKHDRAFNKWDSYIRDGKITTRTKLPGKIKSPLVVDIVIRDPSAATHSGDASAPASADPVVAEEALTLRRTGEVTLSIPFTSYGRAVIERWLAGGRVTLTALATASDPTLGWAAPPALGTAPTSTAFAGYEYANYVAIPESVSAALVVPKVRCGAGDEGAVYPEVAVEQQTSAAGLVIGCNGPQAYYWPSVTVDNAVTNYPSDGARPGDKIDLSVTQSFAATTVTVTDVTRGFAVKQTGAGGGTGVDLLVGLGAWNDQQQASVPTFGTVSFSDAMLNGSPFGSFGTASNLERFDRYTSSSAGTLQIATGAFAGDKTAFDVSFKHS